MATVLVGGAVANKLHNGGEAWVRLSWIRGLQQLGLDVWFVEQIDASTCVDADGDARALRRLREPPLLRRRDGRVRPHRARRAALRGRPRVERRLRSTSWPTSPPTPTCWSTSAGTCGSPSSTRRARSRAYVDLDPGFTQFWHADGWDGPRRATTPTSRSARTSARPAATSPPAASTGGPVPPPVVLDDWPLADDGAARTASRPSARGAARSARSSATAARTG